MSPHLLTCSCLSIDLWTPLLINEFEFIAIIIYFVAQIVLSLANESPSELALGCVDMFLSFSKYVLTLWQEKLL